MIIHVQSFCNLSDDYSCAEFLQPPPKLKYCSFTFLPKRDTTQFNQDHLSKLGKTRNGHELVHIGCTASRSLLV